LTVYKTGYKYNNFNLTFNGICYLLIFILYTWDKFYYIINNKGNKSTYYFNSKIQKECSIHKSYACKCNRINFNEEMIENYINFYKYCSKIVTISNGRIKFVGKKSKNNMKFVI